MSIERIERKRRGAGYRVWFRGVSGRTNPRTFDTRREPRPAGTAAEVPGIRPYYLRHSFASLLLAQGRSVIDVDDQLGHAPTPTLDTYGHVMRELEGRNQRPDEAIAAARQLRSAESG